MDFDFFFTTPAKKEEEKKPEEQVGDEDEQWGDFGEDNEFSSAFPTTETSTGSEVNPSVKKETKASPEEKKPVDRTDRMSSILSFFDTAETKKPPPNSNPLPTTQTSEGNNSANNSSNIFDLFTAPTPVVTKPVETTRKVEKKVETVVPNTDFLFTSSSLEPEKAKPVEKAKVVAPKESDEGFGEEDFEFGDFEDGDKKNDEDEISYAIPGKDDILGIEEPKVPKIEEMTPPKQVDPVKTTTETPTQVVKSEEEIDPGEFAFEYADPKKVNDPDLMVNITPPVETTSKKAEVKKSETTPSKIDEKKSKKKTTPKKKSKSKWSILKMFDQFQSPKKTETKQPEKQAIPAKETEEERSRTPVIDQEILMTVKEPKVKEEAEETEEFEEWELLLFKAANLDYEDRVKRNKVKKDIEKIKNREEMENRSPLLFLLYNIFLVYVKALDVFRVLDNEVDTVCCKEFCSRPKVGRFMLGLVELDLIVQYAMRRVQRSVRKEIEMFVDHFRGSYKISAKKYFNKELVKNKLRLKKALMGVISKNSCQLTGKQSEVVCKWGSAVLDIKVANFYREYCSKKPPVV